MDNDESKYETAPISPGWIKRRVPSSYADDGLKRIVIFYVINTPCTEISSSSIPITEYGWSKNVWKNDALKNVLLKVADLKRGDTFVVAKKTEDIKSSCEKAKLKKGFHQSRAMERVVFFKNKSNEFLSLFWHIRNSLAHGRLAMYPSSDGDIVFALEDGVKRNGYYYVRARMILKKSTLLKWIDIIERGAIVQPEISKQ
ncbi:MAG: hypothetical protein IKQ36_03040 [Clostridia bacterium]|nr:hypothetical protein [Clostridia bacterium]